MEETSIIRILIVDDEPLARKKIRRFLEEETGIEIIGECSDGKEAVEFIKSRQVDLVFLDIRMPRLNGIGVLETLAPGRIPLVVFVTAYDQYAIKAFEFHALDYLLKPFNRGRFQAAMARARETLCKEDADRTAAFQAVLAFLEEQKKKNSYLNRLMVKSGEKIVVLDENDIKWLESDRNYVNIHTGEQTHRIRETLSNMEARLDPGKFARINRSTIINTGFIKEMQPMFRKEYVILFKTGEKFILNKAYYSNLESIFTSQ